MIKARWSLPQQACLSLDQSPDGAVFLPLFCATSSQAAFLHSLGSCFSVNSPGTSLLFHDLNPKLMAGSRVCRTSPAASGATTLKPRGQTTSRDGPLGPHLGGHTQQLCLRPARQPRAPHRLPGPGRCPGVPGSHQTGPLGLGPISAVPGMF